mmetsp:Transcript_16421/g.32103  ORF Transcript_16421/g.32103 Transcript_16421/m.32103 type:complete len:189 (+) Transcript_16421:27-593(+)
MKILCVVASAIGAYAFGGQPLPASACPEDLFGYVNPSTTTIVDSSVPAATFFGAFGFGTMPGGDFLETADVAHMFHYVPGLEKRPELADARSLFANPGWPGLSGAGGMCIRPGPPGCGQYVKTEYEKGCPFLAPDDGLVGGGIALPGVLNKDGLFDGCKVVAQNTYCFQGFNDNGRAISVPCSTCDKQ